MLLHNGGLVVVTYFPCPSVPRRTGYLSAQVLLYECIMFTVQVPVYSTVMHVQVPVCTPILL